MQITLYAGAAAAAGVDRLELDVAGPITADDLRHRLSTQVPGLAAPLVACSLLVGGLAVHDGAQLIDPTAAVDVLPPFAGG